MRYGDFELHALSEGRFTVGREKRFVPYVEGAPLPKGSLFIAVRPFLIKTPGGPVLLDCGLGAWAEGRGVEVLLDGLARHGVAREAVTCVLLSHLHFDHAGGAIHAVGGEDRPLFPNAEYVVQRGELDAPYGASSVEARDRVVRALDLAGQLVLVEGDARVTGEIAVRHTGGHTRDHQAIRLHTGGRTAVFGGDVLATPGQVTRRFLAKYDHDAAHAQAERERIAREAAEHGHLLLFYHATEHPAAFVSETAKGGLAVEPVSL